MKQRNKHTCSLTAGSGVCAGLWDELVERRLILALIVHVVERVFVGLKRGKGLFSDNQFFSHICENSN